jgi:hypothetical protein
VGPRTLSRISCESAFDVAPDPAIRGITSSASRL